MCTAYYLTSYGHQVTVISDDHDHTGCSYGNAGMLVPSHFIPLAAPGVIPQAMKWMLRSDSPFHIRPRFSRGLVKWGWCFYKACTSAKVEQAIPMLSKMHLTSRDLYIQMEMDEGLDFGLQTKGLLMLCKSKKTLESERAVAEKSRKIGIPAEVLSLRELVQVEPNVSFDVAGAIHYPIDAHLSPQKFMSQLKAVLISRGVSFVAGKVSGFERGGSQLKSVRVGEHVQEFDQFIVAAGMWSEQLLKGLEINLPMQAGKGYSVEVSQPRVMPGICALLAEAKVSMTPMNGGIRFGGTMELNGMGRTVNARRFAGLVKSIPQYMPQIIEKDLQQGKPWVGLRPCSPDGLPYVGHVSGYNNLMVSTGHAMMGMSLGPVSGQLIAQLASGIKPTLDLRLLNPGRFN